MFTNPDSILRQTVVEWLKEDTPPPDYDQKSKSTTEKILVKG
jgi:hypothetical protein